MLIMIVLVMAFNLVVFKFKFDAGRYGDMALDLFALALLSAWFGHTLKGMVMVVIVSTILSMYWYIFPPNFE